MIFGGLILESDSITEDGGLMGSRLGLSTSLEVASSWLIFRGSIAVRKCESCGVAIATRLYVNLNTLHDYLHP